MDYIHWNNTISEYLFKPSRSGKEVFLYLAEDDLIQAVREGADFSNNNKVLKDLARKTDSEILADFWLALRTGPVFWSSIAGGRQKLSLSEEFGGTIIRDAPKHPAESAMYAWRDWNNAIPSTTKPGVRVLGLQNGLNVGLHAPLHLLYLACFTLPFSVADTVSTDKSYYDCWNSFFGTPRNLLRGGVPMPLNALQLLGNGIWIQMWQELTRWSQEDLSSERGVMKARQLGKHAYVGWPHAQCLLTPLIFCKLPSFFVKYHLFPETTITKEKMRDLLLDRRNGLDLRKATYTELKKNSELGQAVVDIVTDIFSRWNGTTNRRERKIVIGGKERTIDLKGTTYASLQPFLPVNIYETETISWHYRLKIKSALPEDLELTGCGLSHVSIQPETHEWSREVPGIVPSATRQVFMDKVNNWQVVAQLPEVQVFVPGGRYGFYQWWVPVQALEYGTELLILCKQQHTDVVRKWVEIAGSENSANWSSFGGLPANYNLFWLRNLPENVPGLSGVEISSETKVLVEGGLNCGGRVFLEELPPAFRLINGQSDWRLFLIFVDNEESIALIPDKQEKGLWHLPANLRTDARFRIVVEGKPECISLPYSLISARLPTHYTAPHRDSLGKIIDDQKVSLYYDGVRICGEATNLQKLRSRQVPYLYHFTPSY